MAKKSQVPPAPEMTEKHLSRYCPGDHVTLHAFRRDELFSVEVELGTAPLDTCYFTIEDEEKLKYWLFP